MSEGLAIIAAHDAFYAHRTQLIHERAGAIEETSSKLQGLQELISTINNALKEDKNSVDFSKDQAKRELVDRVRAFAPHAVEGYFWKGEEINRTLQNLGQEVQLLGKDIPVETSYLTQLLHERNQVTEICHEVLKLISKLLEAITANQRRG
jgi:hypothetical protein